MAYDGQLYGYNVYTRLRPKAKVQSPGYAEWERHILATIKKEPTMPITKPDTAKYFLISTSTGSLINWHPGNTMAELERLYLDGYSPAQKANFVLAKVTHKFVLKTSLEEVK